MLISKGGDSMYKVKTASDSCDLMETMTLEEAMEFAAEKVQNIVNDYVDIVDEKGQDVDWVPMWYRIAC
jgi:hypothetical protein